MLHATVNSFGRFNEPSNVSLLSFTKKGKEKSEMTGRREGGNINMKEEERQERGEEESP